MVLFMVHGYIVILQNGDSRLLKLTSRVELPSHNRVSSLFAAGTCLHEHPSQAGIATEDSTRKSSNECECMDAAPRFGGSAFWGC